MSYFLRNGNTFRVADKAALDIHEKLPAGNYIIQKDQFGNMFLEQIDGFNNPKKIYGSATRQAERIMNTFMDRDGSTGVMLNGEKGSGKTLLAKMLSAIGAEQGIPTIVINNPWHGDAFNTLIQDIDQPAIVLFDEFEKVYDRDQQESILTLLDGVFPTKKLFIITCNDKWRVDSHMRNRPGRIYYMLDFKGLEMEFIREYCEDNLRNRKHIDSVCKIGGVFDEFNFDMLKALVEEMNRYGETPQEALRMLNAKPEFGDKARYEVEVIVGGKKVDEKDVSPTVWTGNPLNGQLEISFYDHEDKEDGGWTDINMGGKDLQKIEPQSGRFVFSNQNGTVILSREKTKSVDYYGAF